MEEHSVVKKRSVAELAGKFSCPKPHTTDAEVNKPVRRRPPRSLLLPASNDAAQGQDEKGAETVSPRKNRNSALIEKLQANLALSPTGPLPFPKSPGVLKLPVPSFSPGSPSSPSSPPVIVTPKQEETPASFENPTEGTVLKSIIKGRARHSIKRRPPSRRNRKSSADEEEDKTASATLEPTTPNGHEGDVFEEQKASPDTESLSSKEQIEQETKSTDSEKAEPEGKVETVTSEKKEGEELKEEKMEQELKGEKMEQELKEEKMEQELKEEKMEQELKEEKMEQELKEEKMEQELKEEKGEAEPQLANSTEETREEPVMVPHGKAQTEPDTTDEKEEEQKEDEVNH
ncbi:duboraya isoform X1 [Rhinichthys klamathensis goyatoka]|uniref:duboraya isoform X1 n=1 Tax=Rhinichthys klamathensis goyatoka TaxID=3034132 RepID=UPI0024B558CC|nr:duboraya isoform X1 [Rhinichthys klamathensis goyatoka]